MKQFSHNLKSNSRYQIRVLLILVLFSMFTNFAFAQTTSIPDENFEQALIDLSIDSGPRDGQVLTSNINSVTILDIRDKSITNLAGIEDFANLEELYCFNQIVGDGNDNAITTLDVSSIPNLIRLYCQDNQITNLNISGLTKLQAMFISNNPFIDTTLDVHLNPDLYYLRCQNNGLTDLNISGLTKLATLEVWDNQLTSLDVSNNPNLTYLDCDDNLFTSLDVSALTNLNQFYCNYNSLTSLDVRGLTNLANFQCTFNPSLSCILVDDVAAATLKTTTVDPDPDAEGAFFWYKDDDVTAIYSYCNCDLTTTWNGTSWNPVAPTDGTFAAIIAGDYSQSANINACTLTVNNGAIVSIPSGYNVTLNAPIIVDSGSSFTLGNNANLIQTNKKSVNSGNITVKRNSSALLLYDYTLWSSPVTGAQTLADFSPLTSQSPNRFYIYDTASNSYDNLTPILDPTTTPFSTAKGYLIRMPNTASAVTPTAYPGVFTGTPNNGDIPFTMSAAGGGYNLVGNPYPSPINMTQFVADNTANITGTLYFWRKTNGAGTAYCTWAGGVYTTNNNAQSVDPAGIIQTGQGFFVKSNGGTALTFKNGQRVANTAGQFFKIKQVAAASRIWLNATNAVGDFSQMAVSYVGDATLGVDIFDGKYIDDSKIALTSNINNEEYTIQGRPAFDVSDVVTLNFKTDVAGDYTIAIDHADGLLATAQEVYLVDSKTGTETNLKTSSYTFTAVSGVDNARFSLKYQKTLNVDTATFNDNSVSVYKNNGTLYVNSGAAAIANIKVFDVQGRLIAEQKEVKANAATISNLKATQQVLIVQVTSEDNKVVNKKVVN